MGRIDLEIRDLIYDGLLVREGMRLDAATARERANNLAQIICTNYEVTSLRDSNGRLFEARPDPSEDDDRICTGGGR